MKDYIKDALKSLLTSRLFILLLVFICMGGVLIHRMFTLQIVRGEQYMDTFQLKIEKERTLLGTRGTIYDCNGVPLAYNKLSYSVTIEDNGTYETVSEKNAVLNDTIMKVISIIEEYGGEIDNDFNIILNENGHFEFAVSDTRLARFKADVYGHKSIDELTPLEGIATAEDIIDYLCGNANKYGIYNSAKYKANPVAAKGECPYSNEEKLKIITVRYGMDQNRFQKFLPTTIATDVNKKTVAAIMENADSLQGIEVSEGTSRVYADAKYFSNILGYTGKASQEEIDALKEENDEYNSSDIIGKSGLEQYLETTLRGTNGSEKLFVNNMGKVIEIAERTDPSAGNDVYLSIDADLQKAAYDILEQKIAGILYSKIENISEYIAGENASAADIKIGINEVYYALINNNVLHTYEFADDNASETEKKTHQSFLARQEEVLANLRAIMENNNAPAYKDSSREMKEDMSYIINTFLTRNTRVLDSTKVNTSDSTYIKWTKDEVINISTYLHYALANGWIDVTALGTDSTRYMDSDEAYAFLVDYIIDGLRNDNDFSKLVYKYMIKSGIISGRDICLLLYDQQVLSYDPDAIAGLASGAITPYYFIKEKIQNLEITPAQLALDPCSGSLVITDPSDGSLKALVSYPGYDNNRLANTMDTEYFVQLNKDLSSPFYNHATQEKTAPGSTFKMVSATAGLEEHIIYPDTQIDDLGIFEKIQPQTPRCWIYTQVHTTHGKINVSEAIRHSCNYFFYEVGYELGTVNGVYNSDVGLARLETYAKMYGLEDKTNLEIPETTPQFSDTDAVRSAIGQGTHAYTTAQLSRYVASIANSGTVYNLTLLSKVTDSDGNVLETFSPTVLNKISLMSSTWNCIHTGMRAVVEAHSSFKDMPLAVAGKTGTAQQSTSRPNHALFVCYAPYDAPSVAIACRIPFGYTSSNAAEVGRDVLKYIFNLEDRESLLSGVASEAGALGGD